MSSMLLSDITTGSRYVEGFPQSSPTSCNELCYLSDIASSQINSFENHQDYKLESTTGGNPQCYYSPQCESTARSEIRNEEDNPEIHANYKDNPAIVINFEDYDASTKSIQLNYPLTNDWVRFKSYLKTTWQENYNIDESFDSTKSGLYFRFSKSWDFSDQSASLKINSVSFTKIEQTGNRLSLSTPNLRCGRELEDVKSDKQNSKCLMTVPFAKSVANKDILFVQGENIKGRPTLILRSKDSRTTNYSKTNRSGRLKQHSEWSCSYPSVVNKVPNNIKYETGHQNTEINGEIHVTEKCERIKSMTNFNKMAGNGQYSYFSAKNHCCCFNSCSSFTNYSTAINRSNEDVCKNINDQTGCPCVKEIRQLKRELQEAKLKITDFTEKMEDRSSNRNQPPEQHQRYLNRPSEFNYLNHNSEEMSYPVFSQGNYNPLHQMCNSNGSTPHSYNAHPAIGRTMSYQRHSYGDCDRVPNYDVAPSHQSFFLRRNHDDSRRRELDPSDLVSKLANQDHQALVTLRDQIMALQMRNLELNLFLKKEELQRKEAEEAVRRDRTYIKALEDNIQTLSTSRVVMDPLTYKQVADNYMASRKKPVRRTRTCNPYSLGSEDLVCDAQNQNLQIRKKSTSCPSSPLGTKASQKAKESSKKRLSQPMLDCDDTENLSANDERTSIASAVESSPSTSLSFSTSSFCSIPLPKESLEEEFPTICNNNWSLDASLSHSKPLNQEEYQRLLESIENLDMSAPS